MKNKGFTLIEVVLVITLLAILAGIGIPRIAYNTDTAYRASLKTNLSLLRFAIENYRTSNNGNYPSTETNITDMFVAGQLPENPLNKSSRICIYNGTDSSFTAYVSPTSSSCSNSPSSSEWGWVYVGVSGAPVRIYGNSNYIFQDGTIVLNM